MGNSSSSDRRQSSSTSNRPSSAATAKKTAGKDRLPPMMKKTTTTAGRKSTTKAATTATTTNSPSVNVPHMEEEQGMEVPLTMDEPNLTALSSSEEEDDSSKNDNQIHSDDDDDVVVVLADISMIETEDDDDDDDSSEDEDDESLDEYWAERQAVLSDAKALAQVVSWYRNPNQPVVVDGLAQARCYFDRPSAVPQSSADEEADIEDIMKDVAALKQSAGHFMHPERPVEVSSTACGRNYFDRISASQYEDIDSDVDAEELAEERDMIMKELNQLKTWAGYYKHPERPVLVDDPTCMGRNYFGRASAPEQVSLEEENDREAIMSDMASLKTWAGYYAHPERPVEVDSTATGRNYFTRPSATEYNDEEVEMELVLKEAAQLKQLAGWYRHPERPVTTTDACATGRNYFTRPSAPEYNDEEVERDQVLKEAAQLKQLAGWYKHPERPVECTDPCATARNYFNRASAHVPDEDEEMDNQRDLVLADMAELRKVASWYMHPERPVDDVDPASFGRNYFSRPSAAEFDDEDAAAERERVLADAAELKKTASWYLHPEKPVVTTDPCATGRNYFSRPSAPGYEDFEEEYQRDMVFSDIAELKRLATDYRHPEKPVVTTDPCATGRNYFSRPSAAPTESSEDAEERAHVLEEASALKKLAMDYRHPEMSVVSSIGVGRDFFSRPSAPEFEDADLKEECDSILADAKKLKELASWYHHPEVGVTSSVAVTRNFFTRPSAADDDIFTPEEEDERARILADAAALKKLAVDYAHPEKPVVSKVNCARNYFDRPSAEGHADYIHTQGHALENDHAAVEHNDFDFHQYHYYDQHHHHHHDDDHSHVSRQSDHFEMDEDMFHGFRESMYQAQAVQEQVVPIIKEEKEGEEGKLSRSPSSVMLFDEM